MLASSYSVPSACAVIRPASERSSQLASAWMKSLLWLCRVMALPRHMQGGGHPCMEYHGDAPGYLIDQDVERLALYLQPPADLAIGQLAVALQKRLAQSGDRGVAQDRPVLDHRAQQHVAGLALEVGCFDFALHRCCDGH